MPRTETQQNNLVTEAYKSMTEGVTFGSRFEFIPAKAEMYVSSSASELTAAITIANTSASDSVWKKEFATDLSDKEITLLKQRATADAAGALSNAVKAFDKTYEKEMKKLRFYKDSN